MSSDFAFLDWRPNVKYSAVLHGFVNFTDSYLFMQGHRFGDTFPADVAMALDPDHPRDTVLTDNLLNPEGVLVVSERLADFLRARALGSVEFLSVTVLDHKQKPIPEKYFIVNAFDNVDCLDKEASVPKYSPIRKDRVVSVQRTVIDPKRVAPGRELFRIKGFASRVLVGKALRDAIDAAGFTSIGWTDPATYKG